MPLSREDFKNIAKIYNESVLGKKDESLLTEMDAGGVMGGVPTSGGAIETGDNYASGDTRIPKVLGRVQTRQGGIKPTSKPKKAKKRSKMYWEDEEDPCWKGYNQRGMKEKNGKQVPNCVPEEDCEAETINQIFKPINKNINYDPKELKRGAMVEMEHTNDKKVAVMIAKQHLAEDPHYYSKLKGVHSEEDAESQCTKPTKKASSDRKGKKWTKCAKQPDGSVKRIHWGQAGVKVTGKSGDTKRKKSFRARHNCSNAKKGSAQEAACNDW
jgi:hypothetical protein